MKFRREKENKLYRVFQGKRNAFALCAVVLLSVLFCAACGKQEEAAENSISVYYLNNEETKVEAHSHVLTASDTEGQLAELLEAMSTNPEKLEYKAPLSLGFLVNSTSLADGRVTIDVNADYAKLSATTEVLVRAAIVRTLTAIEEITYVTITVDGSPLYDATGSSVGWMSADQFIDNDGNEINTYELARVKLYFASEDGTKLIAAYREKHYSTSLSLERFVVEELISGPSGQVEGLFASVNPNTKIINVTTKDGICYVNLDETFLTVVNNVPTEVSVYAIVNSLAELSGISKVQVLINGEVPATFSNSTFERNLDIVTTLER